MLTYRGNRKPLSFGHMQKKDSTKGDLRAIYFVSAFLHVVCLIRRVVMNQLNDKSTKRSGSSSEAVKKILDININPEKQLESLLGIFDSIRNGAVVTDAHGYITHFNKAYAEFLGLNSQTPIGKHCTEVIENTRMHIVAKTGKAEMNRIQQIMGQEMMVQRIPILCNDEIVGVFGQVVFQDIKEIKKLLPRCSSQKSKGKGKRKEHVELRSTRYTMKSIVGKSRALAGLKKEALKATTNRFPVLITGDSGTGKELFAQAIHHASPRKRYPFIRINCAAIPEELLESELFGYERGAFTDANPEGKAGKFELAHRGSIFLDEIGELSLSMQPKLLHVLEEKEFERVGGTEIVQSDFRLIAATNRNLDEMMAKGLFRRDLFYRLNVISLQIPPLCERREDIIPLARHLLKKMTKDTPFSQISIDTDVEIMLYNHDWKGNVRELTNVLERAVSSMEGDIIRLDDLPCELNLHWKRKNPQTSSLKQIMIDTEKEAIQRALIETGYNKVRTARMLGIHRTHLYKKAEQYGIALSPDD